MPVKNVPIRGKPLHKKLDPANSTILSTPNVANVEVPANVKKVSKFHIVTTHPMVAIYLATGASPEKQVILNSIGTGAAKHRARVSYVQNQQFVVSDYAVMLGYYGVNPNKTQLFRKQIHHRQSLANKPCIFIDSDTMKYEGSIDWVHYRIAFGSIYPGEANFFNEKIKSNERWESIKERKGIIVSDWRTSGEHILLLGQRGDEGWSMKGLDRVKWINKTIAELRQHTQRPIRIRQHPTARPFNPLEIIDPIKQTTFTDNSAKIPMRVDLQNAWAAIVYNSSAAVGPVIHGIPIFVTDSNCMAWDIANKELSKIENPDLLDRTAWFNKLAYAHWNIDELRDGVYWEHMLRGLK